ncbi:metallophosphoesterase family protein [Haloferula sp. BvORR071]|uniref:metallophosphoesterase family protein n=1 Tax=Haloferula sp. BvORR071 TaxID=1396141 RepID=UPI0005552BF5|nr:metallophosphoesterase family protein [Haloferula sp. BvORR071]
MRTFVIGDIHGHTRALQALLAAIPLGDEDCLILLGDYVDKGPDVKGTLELLCGLASRPHTVFLRGNHDQIFLDAHLDPTKFLVWETLAGENSLASYGAGSSEDLIRVVPFHHWYFLENTCVDWHETENFIFVHGGIRAFKSPAEEEIERLQWMTLSMATPHLSGKTVVCGHTRNEFARIADLGHTICIDTGISKGGKLTCLEMDSFDFWQADAEGSMNSGHLR